MRHISYLAILVKNCNYIKASLFCTMMVTYISVGRIDNKFLLTIIDSLLRSHQIICRAGLNFHKNNYTILKRYNIHLEVSNSIVAFQYCITLFYQKFCGSILTKNSDFLICHDKGGAIKTILFIIMNVPLFRHYHQQLNCQWDKHNTNPTT